MAHPQEQKTTVRLDPLTISFFVSQHHLPGSCVEYISDLLSDQDSYRQLCGVGMLARFEPEAKPMATRWAEELRTKQMRYLEDQFIGAVNALIRKLNAYTSINGDATWSSTEAAQILMERDLIASAQWMMIAAGSTHDFLKIHDRLAEAFSAAAEKLSQGTIAHHVSLFHTIALRDSQAYWAKQIIRP